VRSAAALVLTLAALEGAAAVPAEKFAAPDPSDFERNLLGTSVFVARVRVDGVRAIPARQVADVAKAFENRRLAAADIRELTQRLTRLYVESGYVTSGVLIVDEGVRDGELVLKAFEGTVAQVRFSQPPRWSRPQYLTRLLVPDDEEPVHLGNLQERLAALRDAGVIDRINAELVPLPRIGQSELVVSVEEPRPFGARIDYDNRHSPTIGARRATVTGWHRNVTGWGDTLEARYGDTEGLRDALVAYSAPIPYTRLRIGGRWERSDSLAIDPPQFRALDIQAASATSSIEASYTLLRRASNELNIFAMHDRRRSETTLLGIPFSFVPGIDDGVSRVTANRAGAVYSARGEASVLFARFQASVGRTNVADNPGLEGIPARDFRSYFAQTQYARRIPFLSSQAIARFEVQFTQDTLLPLEKYAVGGANSVRGYRENLMLRDRAALASLEWQVPLTPSDWTLRVSGAVFTDAAWARNVHAAGDNLPRMLASAGVGVMLSGPWGLSGRIYVAQPNRRDLTPKDDWQDRGIHFAISWEPTKLIP
jgi:hemolysin activation/secretion protein